MGYERERNCCCNPASPPALYTLAAPSHWHPQAQRASSLGQPRPRRATSSRGHSMERRWQGRTQRQHLPYTAGAIPNAGEDARATAGPGPVMPRSPALHVTRPCARGTVVLLQRLQVHRTACMTVRWAAMGSPGSPLDKDAPCMIPCPGGQRRASWRAEELACPWSCVCEL